MQHHPALKQRPSELVQLARDWTGNLPEFGMMAETKHDGVRACHIDGMLLTREGIRLHGVGHILDRIGGMERAYGRKLFLDGEFIVAGDYRETLRHVGRGAGAGEGGTLHLFDCLHAEEWRADDCDRPLIERKAMLADLMALDVPEGWTWREGTRGRAPAEPPLSLVRDEWCVDQAAVEAMACRIWSAGGEGVVIKDPDAPYRRNRNAAWLKYKKHGWATRKVA